MERADLEARLERLGFDATDLQAAIAAFQASRGMPESGQLDGLTWRALVEAGFRPGDRVLYLRRPYFRGEDVAWLQAQLGDLGFDPGRVDGIFGERTDQALREFQANLSLPADGIVGSSTIEELKRVSSRGVGHVHGVRELERLRNQHKPLGEASVAVLGPLELEPQVELLAQRLRQRSARVVSLTGADQSHLAQVANAADVEFVAYLDFSGAGVQVAYYSGFRYTSPGGKLLAQMVASALADLALPAQVRERGMTLPILRETQMPAVMIGLDHARTWLSLGAEVADAVAGAIELFSLDPLASVR